MRQSHEVEKGSFRSSLRVRCPYCRQIFRAFPGEFEEDYPDFQCSSCQKFFWLNPRDSSQVIVGKAKQVEKKSLFSNRLLQTPKKICLRCHKFSPIHDEECSHCGLVFIKFMENAEASPFELRALWGNVIKNWYNQKAHDAFLASCYKRNDLFYGIFCYGRVLKSDLNNKIAKKMIQRMEGLTWLFKEKSYLPKGMIKYRDVLHKAWEQLMSSHLFDVIMLTFFIGVLSVVFLF